jgi:RNA polymerase sigma-70 factor (ECF subfamily)
VDVLEQRRPREIGATRRCYLEVVRLALRDRRLIGRHAPLYTYTDPMLDADVRLRCESGDLHGAATLAIQGLGPELMGFLVVVVGDPAAAGDVFTDVCVRMWKGLATFRWESSLRTWVYVLARRACHAYRKSQIEWRQRHVPLSDVPEVDALIVQVRTTTLANLAGRGATRAERLRAQLEPDEQMLLILRLDRELDWREIARVLADHDAELATDELTRAAAALRKRFERIKEKLRRLAAQDG